MTTLADALFAARSTSTTTAPARRAVAFVTRARRIAGIAAIAAITVAGAFAGTAAGSTSNAQNAADVDEDAMYAGIHVQFVDATPAELAEIEAEHAPAIACVATRAR